jgi:hypothetical protein
VEFQLLGAKIAEKANNLQMGEMAIWDLFALYQGFEWDGYIEYPNEFSMTSQEIEYSKLQMARTAATGPDVLALIDQKIQDLLNQDTEADLETADDSESDLEAAGEAYSTDSGQDADEQSADAAGLTELKTDQVATPDRIKNTPDVAPTMTRAGTNPGSTISQVGGSKNMTTTRIKAADANRFGR